MSVSSGMREEGATYREPVKRYLEQEIRSAHTVDLVIHSFDCAIAACTEGDADKASRSLALLEHSLNPHVFPELGHSLLGIYGFCRALLSRQQFDEALAYLRALRSAWIEVKARI